jgi:thermostable 8-oxoguanine DNA glycosylase
MQQLNFLTGYDDGLQAIGLQEKQGLFWDDNYNKIQIPRKPRYVELEEFFSNLDYTRVAAYKAYWKSITPVNDSEVFQRWLFAFMSVHTSWKANIIGYEAIKDWWVWLNRWDYLKEAIDRSRVGMQNNRTKYIEEFAYKFWENPSVYRKDAKESWIDFRNRLKDTTLGLGLAKTSFALEMCYPTSAKLTCLDTHMFQAYSLNQVKDIKCYEKLEQHWVDMCTMWNISPYIARCLYWDTKQGFPNSRYWSHVLEQ